MTAPMQPLPLPAWARKRRGQPQRAAGQKAAKRERRRAAREARRRNRG